MVEKHKQVKKIKKREGIDFNRKTEQTKGVGRKKLEDKELSKEMIEFAWLCGMGMDPTGAGRKIGLSDYQIRAYSDLPKVQEEIEKVRSIRSDAELKRWVELDDNFRIIAIQTINRFATRAFNDDKPPSKTEMEYMKFLLAEWDKKRVSEGMTNQPIKLTAKRTITQKAFPNSNQQTITYNNSGEINFDDQREETIEDEISFEEVEDDDDNETQELDEDDYEEDDDD